MSKLTRKADAYMKVSGILAQENANRSAIKSVMQHFLIALDAAACAVYAKNWLSSGKEKKASRDSHWKEEEGTDGSGEMEERTQHLELLWATDMDEQIGQDQEELEVANYVISSGKTLCRMVSEEQMVRKQSFFDSAREDPGSDVDFINDDALAAEDESGFKQSSFHFTQKTKFDMIETEALQTEEEGLEESQSTSGPHKRRRFTRRASMLHQHSRLQSVFGCPLFDGSGEVIGCVIFGNKQPLGSPFTEDDQVMVKHFLHHISLVLINSHLREVERQATIKTNALLGVARMANRSLEIGTLIRGSMAHFQKLLKVERCLIYVYEEAVSRTTMISVAVILYLTI